MVDKDCTTIGGHCGSAAAVADDVAVVADSVGRSSAAAVVAVDVGVDDNDDEVHWTWTLMT